MSPNQGGFFLFYIDSESRYSIPTYISRKVKTFLLSNSATITALKEKVKKRKYVSSLIARPHVCNRKVKTRKANLQLRPRVDIPYMKSTRSLTSPKYVRPHAHLQSTIVCHDTSYQLQKLCHLNQHADQHRSLHKTSRTPHRPLLAAQHTT